MGEPGVPASSLAGAPPAERVGRLLASPTGVLLIVPLLVIAAGVVIMMLGRRATLDASDSMARRQLAAQAIDVQRDVAFALDQAQPLIVSLRALADPQLPITDVVQRMRDLVIGRPGIANVAIAFPSGVLRGTYYDAENHLRIQESIVGPTGTKRTNYAVQAAPSALEELRTDYDPRTRPFYKLATDTKARVWMPPHVFFTTKNTGLTLTEPLYAPDGTLVAVTTVDFDVTALSSFISRAPFEGARTVMFAADGTILAFPAAPVPDVASKENRLLRAADYNDPALTALMTQLGDPSSADIKYLELKTADGTYLASVAPVGGKRAGIAAPLDWYLATLVPEHVLLGPTHRLERQSFIASLGAMGIALGVALMFAWNLVRMRRAVGVAREQARSAEARVRELGSYRLVARLGAGGMGEVWRAEHRLLARQAAIKLVRPEALRDPEHAPKIRERFRREAQTLASMRSQHTIAIYDYGVTDEGTFFYVMELLDGVDLDRLVRDQGALPAARVIRLLIQACQSLAEAHDGGLLHRDIKPANLFVCRCADEVDVLKVLDFGIVHTIAEPLGDPVDVKALAEHPAQLVTPSGRLTAAGAVVGTPGFIAPEQVYGAKIDARADLYALGCVAWWLLAGREVFPVRDDDAALRAHATEPTPELRPCVNGWLPPELEQIVISLLAKSPDDRPADARALAAKLRAIAIPDEHAWTDNDALAWWQRSRPVTTIAAPDAKTIAPRLIIPSRAEAPTVES